jgi:sugar lactone lactonase YvrE
MTLSLRRFRPILALSVAAAVTLGIAGVAVGQGHIEQRFAFDESAGQLPEGVAVDKQGNIFVSLAPLGELWVFEPGSDTPELFGQVDGIDPSTDLGLLGLAADARGNVYGGVQSLNPDANGVWIFDTKTGEANRIPGSEVVGLANDVAFDKRGNLYITDSLLGAIWRVPRAGSIEPWSIGDPNLAGTGALGLGVPIGANGIEYRHGTLYVAVTEQFSLVSVPIAVDGSAGDSSIVATFAPDSFGFPGAPDGIALDVHGNVYVALIAQQKVAKVTPSGDVSDAATGELFDWPSSIAFGTGMGDKQTLFAVNFSIGESSGDPFPRPGPSLLAIDMGVPGASLP